MRAYETPEIRIAKFSNEEILGESNSWTELPEDEFEENETY